MHDPTPTPPPTPFAPVDPLGREIQSVLEAIRPKSAEPTSPIYRGYALSASEAYLHLSRERSSEAEVRVRKHGRGDGCHWWLEDPRGRIVDLTLNAADRRAIKEDPSLRFPYEDGIGAMFRTGPHKPSKRAAAIITLVRARE